MDQAELYVQKVELLLELHSKKFLAELAAIKTGLGEIKDTLAALQRAPPPPHPAAPGAAAPPPEAATAQAPAAATPGAAAPNAPPPKAPPADAPAQAPQRPIDRNNVAPADVIEKIFYFGKK